MKANVQLEIEKEDLAYELKELVREVASNEVRKLIHEQAAGLVAAEIEKILEPLVFSALTEQPFEFQNSLNFSSDRQLKTGVEVAVKNYLNAPHYIYSKTETAPSRKYQRSTSGGKSLITLIVQDQIAQFVDEEFSAQVSEKLRSILADKEALKEVFENQVQDLVVRTFAKK